MDCKLLPVFSFGSEWVCCYCGDPSQGRDHVIPVSSQTTKKRRGKSIEGYGPFTYACQNCNGHLTTRQFDSFQARCQFARNRLAKLCKPIEWGDMEVTALDYSLRRYIEINTAKRKWIQERTDWFESRNYYLNIEGLLWEYLQLRATDQNSAFLMEYFRETVCSLKGIYVTRQDSWDNTRP